MTGKSSWVSSRTEGLFPLVAGYDVSWLLQELDDSYHIRGVRSWAWSFLVTSSMLLLLELTWILACILNEGNISFKLLCFRSFLTQVVINILNSDVYQTTCEMEVTCDLFVESLRSWLVCWLVWNPSWFRGLQGLWEFDYVKATALAGVFRSWSLVNWAILLHSLSLRRGGARGG